MRFKALGLFVLLPLLILVFIYGLNYPAKPYFDEVHYVKFIHEFFEGKYNQYATTHPPFWFLLTSAGVKIFGDHSWVWRLVSLLAGLGVLGALYYLAKKITHSVPVALLAVFFMVFDCLSLTQARVAMMNSLMLLLGLLSVIFFLKSTEEGPTFSRGFLCLAGLFFGLAFSTKLVAASYLLFFAPLVAVQVSKEGPEGRFLSWFVLCFVLIPIGVFVAVHSFIPFLKGRTWADIWNITTFHWRWHTTGIQKHPYVSEWWSWPLMLRPLWASYSGSAPHTVQGIIFIGNPVLFWLCPIPIGYLLWQFFKKHSAMAGIILLGFFSQWLCFSLAKRIQFFHYFYGALPFLAMAYALLAVRVWRMGRVGPWVVAAFLLVTAGMFVFWYPLLTGLPISDKYYGLHIWFRKWI